MMCASWGSTGTVEKNCTNHQRLIDMAPGAIVLCGLMPWPHGNLDQGKHSSADFPYGRGTG